MDIYDELEPLVPQERKEAFLRLVRPLKEYGDHNPELLRIVEAMGFLSLYTTELPKRLNDTIAQAQTQLTTELKAYHTSLLAALRAANNNFQKDVAALGEAAHSARSLAHQLTFPDADKIKAATESAGKTSSGLNKLLISLTEHYPRWGGLILDPKGVYWRTVQTMMEAAGRPEDFAVFRVRSPQNTAQHYQPLRFNLIGEPAVPCSTYAQMIVDTHAAHRAGSASGNSDFFNQRAMEHICKCFELMRALNLPFNLRTAYNLLANKDHLKNTLDTVPDHPRAKHLLPLVQHFETFYLNFEK